MFIRKVRNRSGNTAIQVVAKKNRYNKILKHLGTARTPLELQELTRQAQQYIDDQRIKSGIISLFDTRYLSSSLSTQLQQFTFLQALDTITYQFFKYFYQRIGINKLVDSCFQDLVIARIIKPLSKRKTKELLQSQFGKEYSLSTIYRTLAKAVNNHYQEKVEVLLHDFVAKELKQDITVLYFDVTTLYYEAFDEDDFRKCGFSKDNKFNQPQVVVGLTVTTHGFPLHMRMFAGNKFEGHTMVPCIKGLIQQHKLQDFVVVADSAMLSQDNLQKLEKQKVHYIVGARLGNLSQKLFNQIIAIDRIDGSCLRVQYQPKRYLIVSYSSKRAAKDKHDREKQIKKAESLIKNPAKVVNRYKFLTKSKQGNWQLNQKMVEKAIQLEGLKGYITNSRDLTDEEIIQKYGELWQVEKAFRMSKSDLKARPIFHTTQTSIKAHLLIVFVALAISRYVEFLSGMSLAKVISELNTVKEVIIEDKVTKQTASKFTAPSSRAMMLIKLAKLAWVT